MSSSFKDQLLGLGFKTSPKPAENVVQKTISNKPAHGKPVLRKPHAKPQTHTAKSVEMDLAKAFTLRQQDERRLREQAERDKQEQARIRKIAKEQVAALLKDALLNKADADIARHFPYGGKIKRIYVTAEQLVALNAGELAVVQQAGKFCLVEVAIALQIKALIPTLLALHCDGTEQLASEEYIDPQFQVPDDLIW
jgi:uncharacterized protein YaiL (DUF2058 family)